MHLLNREKASFACNLNESLLEPLRQRQQLMFYDFIREHKDETNDKQGIIKFILIKVNMQLESLNSQKLLNIPNYKIVAIFIK